jgi:DNA (cytosine-5)-methyltransferase 1
MLTVGDLFSGIGGFSLGLERAGMRTAWFAEVDPYASAVLKKHWPEVPNFGDVRSIRAGTVERVDVLCGGFPCTDISNAGKRAGIDGEQSGLWSEYARIVGELRPRYVIVENVAALLGRGIERVLGDLAALGFDAEWHCIPASAVGAPHRRDRVWIVAHARSAGRWQDLRSTHADEGEHAGRAALHMFEPCREGAQQHVADADEQPAGRLAIAWGECDQWLAEPNVGRVANGVPHRVDRLRCLGNAIVPQIAEIIGRAIVSAEQ